jgi:hypothetical protein
MCDIFEIEWWKLGSFFSGVVALAIALFIEPWKRWQYKPRISLEAGDESPLSQVFRPATENAWVMLRLKVLNEGNDVATDVEAHLADMSVITPGGDYQSDPRFVPVRLNWSHGEGALKKTLSPQTSGLIDFGRITSMLHPHKTEGAVLQTPPPSLGSQFSYGNPWMKTELALCTEVSGEIDIWTYKAGSYRFKILVSCTRGVLWKGWLELKFETARLVHNPMTGVQETQHTHHLICGCPEPVGYFSCSC